MQNVIVFAVECLECSRIKTNLEMFLHERAASFVADGSRDSEHTQRLSVTLEEMEVGHEVGHCRHVTERQLMLHL